MACVCPPCVCVIPSKASSKGKRPAYLTIEDTPTRRGRSRRPSSHSPCWDAVLTSDCRWTAFSTVCACASWARLCLCVSLSLSPCGGKGGTSSQERHTLGAPTPPTQRKGRGAPSRREPFAMASDDEGFTLSVTSKLKEFTALGYPSHVLNGAIGRAFARSDKRRAAPSGKTRFTTVGGQPLAVRTKKTKIYNRRQSEHRPKAGAVD